MPILKHRSSAAFFMCVAACVFFAGCGEIAPTGDGVFTFVTQRNNINSHDYGLYDDLSGLAIAPTSGTIYMICSSGTERRVVPFSASTLVEGLPLDLAAVDPDLVPYEVWIEGSDLHILCGGNFNGADWNDVMFDAETGDYADTSYDATWLVDTWDSFTTMRVVGGDGGVYFIDPLHMRIGFSVLNALEYEEPTTLIIDEARLKSYLPYRDRKLAPILGDISWDGSDRLAVSVLLADSDEGGCVLVLDASTLDLVQYIGGDWLLEGPCGLDYDDSGLLVVADRWGESVRVFQDDILLDWSSEDDASGGVEEGVLDEPIRLRVHGDSILALDNDGDHTSSLIMYSYAP